MVIVVVEFSSGVVQNWKDFCLNINMPIGAMGRCQKLGIILENELIQKLILFNEKKN